MPSHKQKRDLLEGRVLDQVADVIAAIDQPAGVAVDEADLALGGDDAFQPAPAFPSPDFAGGAPLELPAGDAVEPGWVVEDSGTLV